MKSEQELQAASTSELLEWFNQLSDKPVKRFADRKTAIRRCMQLLQAQHKESGWAGGCPACKEKTGQRVSENSTHRNVCGSCNAEYYNDTGRIYCIDGMTVRGKAIAESWKDEETKNKRSIRHCVRVDGVEYRSVKQAFEALGLPLKEHIKFRMELKAAGVANAYDKKWEAIEV